MIKNRGKQWNNYDESVSAICTRVIAGVEVYAQYLTVAIWATDEDKWFYIEELKLCGDTSQEEVWDVLQEVYQSYSVDINCFGGIQAIGLYAGYRTNKCMEFAKRNMYVNVFLLQGSNFKKEYISERLNQVRFFREGMHAEAARMHQQGLILFDDEEGERRFVCGEGDEVDLFVYAYIANKYLQAR